MARSRQDDTQAPGGIPASERVDKWLWMARFFRHRAQATNACDAGLVTVGASVAKPAQVVRIGTIVRVGEPGLLKVIQIERIPGKRLGAVDAMACYTVLEAPPPVRSEARRAWLDELLAPGSNHGQEIY